MYYATAVEMQTLDNLAVQNGLEIRQMMELAGWHMLALFDALGVPRESKVVVVVGKGNKGGDGLAAARHLANHGRSVSVILLSLEMSADAGHHLALVKKMDIPILAYEESEAEARTMILGSDILIDALIGYNLQGSPRGVFAQAIKLMNNSKKKIIAYDLPSGIDATSGECHASCIRAEASLVLALPKRALQQESAKHMSGRIFIADIGIPDFLYDMMHRGSRPHFDSTGLAVIP